jgi:hypothetical protein
MTLRPICYRHPPISVLEEFAAEVARHPVFWLQAS